MQPVPHIPDSLIVLTTGQSHLASLNYYRIIVIPGFSSTRDSQLLSSFLFHITKDNSFCCSLQAQKTASTFSPRESKPYLLVIPCVGVMIQELTDIWSTYSVHIFRYFWGILVGIQRCLKIAW